MNSFHDSDDKDLHRAIRICDRARIAELLASGVDASIENFDGAVPLTTCACEQVPLEIAQLLIDSGADPAVAVNWRPPLVEAAMHNHHELARLLLKAGASPSCVDEDEESALMWAIIKGNTELALSLLDAGADPHAKSRHGSSARDYALEQNNERILAVIDGQENRKDAD